MGLWTTQNKEEENTGGFIPPTFGSNAQGNFPFCELRVVKQKLLSLSWEIEKEGNNN
jgi:hypothetical protein